MNRRVRAVADDPTNLPAAEMLLGEARGMIAEQRSALETLRTRALALLSVASAVAAFFATRLPKHLSHSDRHYVWLAAGAFGLSVFLAMAIVRPRRLLIAFEIQDNIDYMKTGETVRLYDLTRERAEGLSKDWDTNESKMRRLSWYLTGICALVAVQVAAWAIVTRAG